MFLEVCDLPRHLRDVHNWIAERASKVTGQFNLRKEYTYKKNCTEKRLKKAQKDYHRKKRCPYVGSNYMKCGAVVLRLDKHLRFVHKIDPSSPHYQKLLREALYFSDPSREALLERRNKRHEKEAIMQIQDMPSSDSYSQQEDNELPTTNISPEETNLTSIDKKFAETVFIKFLNFLMSPDSANRAKDSAKQTVSEVKRILEALRSARISTLCDGWKLREMFFKKRCKEKGYQPETVKKFLRSLMDFYSFLISDKIDLFDGVSTEDILKMKT